jgi:hypothetical protein
MGIQMAYQMIARRMLLADALCLTKADNERPPKWARMGSSGKAPAIAVRLVSCFVAQRTDT